MFAPPGDECQPFAVLCLAANASNFPLGVNVAIGVDPKLPLGVLLSLLQRLRGTQRLRFFFRLLDPLAACEAIAGT